MLGWLGPALSWPQYTTKLPFASEKARNNATNAKIINKERMFAERGMNLEVRAELFSSGEKGARKEKEEERKGAKGDGQTSGTRENGNDLQMGAMLYKEERTNLH